VTIRYFKKIKNRVEKLEWLTESVSINTEYDEDADVGIIGGSITFKDGSIFHFKEVLLGKSRQVTLIGVLDKIEDIVIARLESYAD
jgi:hypothetical protein